MLKQKWVRHALEIVKDRSCSNQNVMKRNMETRNNYLLEKKGSKKKIKDRGRPSTTYSSSKKNQRLEAIN